MFRMKIKTIDKVSQIYCDPERRLVGFSKVDFIHMIQWHEDRARAVMQQLHCGSENGESARASDIADAHYAAAALMRLHIKATVVSPKTDTVIQKTEENNPAVKIPKPSPEDIRIFLDAFKKLDEFECRTRLIREHGAFNSEVLPIPAVVTVLAWLKNKING